MSLDKRISGAKLADLIGELDAQSKAIAAKLKEAKAEFAAREEGSLKPSFELIGATYKISASHVTTSRIDTKRIRADMGENFVAMYSNTSDSVRVNVRVLPAQLIAA